MDSHLESARASARYTTPSTHRCARPSLPPHPKRTAGGVAPPAVSRQARLRILISTIATFRYDAGSFAGRGKRMETKRSTTVPGSLARSLLDRLKEALAVGDAEAGHVVVAGGGADGEPGVVERRER